MRIHLVFEPDISAPMQQALKQAGYEVTGYDFTLYQFRDFVSDESAHDKASADIAIVDASLGINNTSESIKTLRQIRSLAPDLRIIAILSQDASKSWVKGLVNCGIYDIYTVGTFSKEDITRWIENRKTLADYESENISINEKIQGKPRFKNARGSGDRPAETIEKIVGTVSIGIAGVTDRCGSTHASLSIASFIAGLGHKVAMIECHGSDLKEFATTFDIISVGEKEVWIQLLMGVYDYVIFDFGNINTCDEHEYMRCTKRFLISGVSDWDVQKLYEVLDKRLTETSAGWDILLNFSNEERFHEISGSLTAKEKRSLKIQMYQLPFNVNALEPHNYYSWLSDVLPKLVRKNKTRIIHKIINYFEGRFNFER